MTFLHPWLLTTLLVLPIAYWLIRIIPPPATTQVYPPLQLLKLLKPQHETASRPNIWLLLMRVMGLMLIILGFAQPVWTPRTAHTALPDTDLVVILDNGALAAPNWQAMITSLSALASQSLARGHRITLYTTARHADVRVAPPVTLRQSSDLSRDLYGLTPVSWAASRTDALASADLSGANVVFISNGIAASGDTSLQQKFNTAGHVFIMSADPGHVFALSGRRAQENGYDVTVAHVSAQPTDILIAVENAQRDTILSKTVHLAAGSHAETFAVPVPPALQVKAARISVRRVGGQDAGPAATFLLDRYPPDHPVGLISDHIDQGDVGTPEFYLRRALPLVAALRVGTLDQLLARNLSVIVWPSNEFLDVAARARLVKWVTQGGTLVRFVAAHHEPDPTAPSVPPDPLLPVQLSNSLRDLDSVMSWEKSQSIAPFRASSPFVDLTVPADISIRKTIIAQPDAALPGKIWAQLTDGTPLVTGAALGRGMRVLFHVDSEPSWSNLPLTGLFPDMLERIIQRSTGIRQPDPTNTLTPLQVLDDRAALQPPPATVQPLQRSMLDRLSPDATHPPGLYGTVGSARAYNLGPFYNRLQAQNFRGARLALNAIHPVKDFGAMLLLAGITLLFLDLVLRMRRLGLLGRVMLIALTMQVPASLAQDASVRDAEAARDTRLAYVVTGDAETDTVSQQGLRGLSDYTSDRTSAVLAPPNGVIPGKDDLAPYPLIYWPIIAHTPEDPQRNAALNHFIETGGMLVIDVTRDTLGQDQAQAQERLARVTRGIAIPELVRLDSQHILSHCFYILHSFPGRVAGQPVWVARDRAPDQDHVSPVIIGSGQWAHAWAVDAEGHHPFAVLPGDDAQRTQAERFGVNIVIYALTGNYKRDQMHVPELLKRMAR